MSPVNKHEENYADIHNESSCGHVYDEGILKLISCFRNFGNHRNLLEFMSWNLLESVRITLQFG